MAQRTTVTVFDDLEFQNEGRKVDAEHPDKTFMIDGRHYEIDLSAPNYQKLMDILAPFIQAGRRVTQGGGVTRRRSPVGPGVARIVPDRDAARVIRAWAAENGWPELRDARGRIPGHVLDAYQAAQRNGGTRVAPPAAEPEPEPSPVEPRRFATQRDANQAIREFIRQQGITVSARGAIPKEFRQMYAEAHGGDPIVDE